ncbi:hypothetical protein LC605_31550 [Nostoc sp. CHAB 5836]|nr:hypothetical protein [Nostoc sp. CHAB 5836]
MLRAISATGDRAGDNFNKSQLSFLGWINIQGTPVSRPTAPDWLVY